MAVTLTLAFSIKRMIQDQNLVRRMEACETMGGANYICSDKTGTLTKNEMNIIKIHQGVNEIDLREAMLKPEYKGNPTDIFSSEYYELFKIISACNSSTEVLFNLNSFLIMGKKNLHLRLIWHLQKLLRFLKKMCKI